MYCEKFSMGKKKLTNRKSQWKLSTVQYVLTNVKMCLTHGILKQVPEDEKLHPVISRKTSKKNVYIGSAIACALVLLIIVGFAFSSGSGKNDNDTVSSTESVESTQK